MIIKISVLSTIKLIFLIGGLVALTSIVHALELVDETKFIISKTSGFEGGIIDPAKFVSGISHINIIVDDIEYATEFYKRTLGFIQAHNEDGEMNYKEVTLGSFARNAGFMDGIVKVDVRFLKHPTIGLYLELMKYDEPIGLQEIVYRKTNDLGGVRHVALEVSDAERVFYYLKEQPDVKMINSSSEYGPPELLAPFPIKFFYWLDPWGVQWEMEEGRPIGNAKAISG